MPLVRPGTAAEARIDDRRAKAWDARVRGRSLRQIAAELDVSVSTAFEDIHAVTAQLRGETSENAEHHRAVQLSRLDRAIGVLDSLIEDPDTSLQAIDRLVSLERRRADLLGLDAATKHEHAVTAGETNPGAAAKLVREAFPEHGSRAPVTAPTEPGEPRGDGA